MKKITLLLSLLASSLMAAEFEIYGQAHLSADAVDSGQSTTTTLASNASRLGIKAAHLLPLDITVFAQYEMGVDLSGRGSNDDGNGGDFNAKAGGGNTNGFFTSARESFIGVYGAFGKIYAGNIDAQNQWIYDYNLFADQIGDLGNLLGAGGVGADRASGTIAYSLPKIGGLSALVAYMPASTDKGSQTNHDDVSAVIAKVNYRSDLGIQAGIGYIGLLYDIDTKKKILKR